jgi:hypothetical protein
MSVNEKLKTYTIVSYCVSDYLLITRLLNDDLISWDEAKIKLLSSRATNHVSNVRKIVGDFNCIKNITIETPTSYFQKYKLNPEFKEVFQKIKNQFESNPNFMKRLNNRLEKNEKYKLSKSGL